MSKTIVVRLRATEDERRQWQEKADASGSSLSDWIRLRLNVGDVSPVAFNRPQGSGHGRSVPTKRAAHQPPPSRKAVPSPVVPDFTKGKS